MTLDEEQDIIIEDKEKLYEDNPIYKKWFKTKTQSGFVSVKPFFKASKVVVDIGEFNAEGKLISATACYIDAVTLAIYLNAIVSGHAARLYPPNEKTGLPTEEALVVYGGSNKDNKAVSRVFKSHHYPFKKDDKISYYPHSFIWKCGQFEGKVMGTGAIMPVFTNPISANSIKLSRLELTELSYRLNSAILIGRPLEVHLKENNVN